MAENIGKIAQIIGPVVDVSFDTVLPAIYNALKINNPKTGTTVTAEVAQHLGNNLVRAVSLAPTDGMTRGMPVVDTGAPIMIPVGRPTLGRVLDLLGNPVDPYGPCVGEDYYPIHRQPPRLEDQDLSLDQPQQGRRNASCFSGPGRRLNHQRPMLRKLRRDRRQQRVDRQIHSTTARIVCGALPS